mgnify:FL=1
MFEITYKESEFLGYPQSTEGVVYDFTFGNRCDIFHRPRGKVFEYIALDRTTGKTSWVLERKTPMDVSEYPDITPQILYSIKYTGDPRYKGASSYSAMDLMDIIFKVLMPKHGYYFREQQYEMALSIFHGLNNRKVTLCEAEVGTGKTMTYLVAGFLAKLYDKSYSFMGYPVTITTSSIELQKSIMEKELPALSAMLKDFGLIDAPLTAVLRKGKDHYFCPRRYGEYLHSISLFPLKYSEVIDRVQSLNLMNGTLDLDPVPLNPYIKARICVKGSCHNCPCAESCEYARFLETASKPYNFDFQITNHNLFLTAQKSRSKHSTKGGLLPCNFCIVDEAHKLLDTASDIFTAFLDFSEVEDFLNAVKHNGGTDFTARAEYFHLLKEAQRLNRKLVSMFSSYQFKSCEDVCHVKIEITEQMDKTIRKLIAVLQKIGNWSAPKGATGANTAQTLVDKLSAFLLPEENEEEKVGMEIKENIVWISYDKSTNTKSLCCMPTQMKDSLRTSLWTTFNTHFALTSGTMKDDTGFSFFKDELGITGCLGQYSVSEFSCESPFDYRNHTRLYISADTPIPDMRDPEYIPAIAREVVKLVKATHGHTAVLFTSYKALNAVYNLVKDELKEYPLIKMSRSNKTAITQFKNSGNGILFASGSMWEGVDCAGDILSSVIIVRLPFPLRSQAMEFKKMSCKNTKEFVQKYAVPQMIIKLRQGAGRLIRNETDTGVLAILDARAAQGGVYRTRVLNTLRKYPLVSSISDVASFIDSVKDESYKKEVPRG